MNTEEVALLREPMTHGIPEGLINSVKLKGIDEEAKIVTVSSQEAWPRADCMHFVVNVQYGGKPVAFKMRGVSNAEWDFIQDKNKLPEAATPEDEKDPEFIALHGMRSDARRVSLFELVLNSKIPGKTEEEKVRWLRSQCTISIQNLFDTMQSVALGVETSDLEAHYKMHLLESREGVEFSGFETLETLPTYSFIRGRLGQSYVSVFGLNAITEDVKITIEDANKLEAPPTRPGRLIDGSLDYQNPEPWHNEPIYSMKAAKVKLAKTAAYMEHCIPFDIPDNEWINSRQTGDVLRMKLFIQHELLDPTARTSLF